MGEKISFIDLFGTELEIEDEYAREQLADESATRAEDVAVLSARMDTFTALPSGSTAGDAELMDIRVGADGVTYPNAGDAVRGQTNKLKETVSTLTGDISYTTESGYFAANGTLASASEDSQEVYSVDYIPVEPKMSVILRLLYSDYFGPYSSVWACICTYDKNKTFISRNVIINNVRALDVSGSLVIPNNCFYIRVSYRTWGVLTNSTLSYCGISEYLQDEIETTRERTKVLETVSHTAKQLNAELFGNAYNLIEFNGKSYTGEGVTFTTNPDNTITVRGTATATTVLNYGTLNVDETGNYYLYGAPYTPEANTWLSYIVGTSIFDRGEGAHYSNLAPGTYTLRFIVYSGASVDFTFAPRLVKYDVNGNFIKTNEELTKKVKGLENNSSAYWRSLFCPYYDHTFINKVNGSGVTIPSESIFNIQSSRRLGFKVIEANVKATSDNYIVCHGGGTDSLYFGGQFEHIDGVTDIANTLISSVSISWIKENIRYKSMFDKFKVAPLSLEEFLLECKKNGLVPLVQYVDDTEVEIVKEIFGDNFILYNGRRELTDGPIMLYSNQVTKENILSACDNVGAPCLYNMANPGAFTDEQLKDIADAMHKRGYWIGAVPIYSGMETVNQRLFELGFDFMASAWSVPDFDEGNLCNIISDFDFSDFSTTGTTSNNVLNLTEGQTVQPATNIPGAFLAKSTLHILFDGKIKVTMGDYITDAVLESDGSKTKWLSTYYNIGTNTFLITALENTTIQNIEFKCSAV